MAMPNGALHSPQSFRNCSSPYSSPSPNRSPWNEVEQELPPSVVWKLQKICSEQDQPAPDAGARRGLVSIGEQASLKLLDEISHSKIRSISAYITYMINNKHSQQISSAEYVSPSPKRYYSSPSSSSSYNTPGNVPLFSSCSSSASASRHGPLFRSYADDEATSKREILSPPLSPLRRCPQSYNYDPEISEFSRRPSAEGISYQLSVLSTLEFRKFFLVLNYIGRCSLEDVVTLEAANDIVNVGNQSMASFEAYIWSRYGHLCKDNERLLYTDWDSGRSHLFYCNVDSNDEYRFKGPYLNATRTHLQQALGDENVLIVRFLDDAPKNARKIIDDGILVGLRRYRFFVFKDEEKKKSSKEGTSSMKCYFVRMETLGHSTENFILHGRTVRDARCLFMHVHTVPSMAKYMARFSLILSKTVKLPVDLGRQSDVKISTIEDIYCRDEVETILEDGDGSPLIQTDGTGFISLDLARKCPNNFYKVKNFKDGNAERFFNGEKFGDAEYQNMEPPLIMQCRLFYQGCAVKGTLLVDKRLPESTIQIRPSMVKVGTDPKISCPETFNSLEIVKTSHKPKRAFLSKNLIALLSYGGVPKEYFLGILDNALEETQKIHFDEVLALKAASNYEDLDIGFIAKSMILSGVPLTEPHLQSCLSSLNKAERSALKGGRLPISDSFYLIGTADPTGTLERDEVCVILDYGHVVGDVLVYRNPGLHFGDIHKLNAVRVEKLDEIVGNAKYAIFFSTKGHRSVANEIANGDFDGDVYWVSLNQQLLNSFVPTDPWERFYSTPKPTNIKPSEFSPDELEYQLFQMFLEKRRPSYSMSTAADSWLALMDRLLVLGENDGDEMENLIRKMYHLIDLYYDALDAPKSGKKVYIPKDLKEEKLPHFMSKGRDSYQSTSVLGEIYDRVVSYENRPTPPVEIKKLPCFNINIPDECLRLWRKRYNEYRVEMRGAMECGGELADEVIKKYRELYELEESVKSMREIYDSALAIYHVTYDHAKDVSSAGKCGFAWKVAGSALCKLHAELQAKETNGKAMVVSPAVLQKILHLRV